MEKEINVSASELEKGAESITAALRSLQEATDKVHLITFNFNNQTSWFKVDMTKPEEAHIIYFNESHRAMLRPLQVPFEEFLSRYAKGSLLDWDKHNRIEHSVHGTPYPNAISKDFVEHCPRIDVAQHRELSVLSTPMKSPSRFGFFGQSTPTAAPAVMDEKKLGKK